MNQTDIDSIRQTKEKHFWIRASKNYDAPSKLDLGYERSIKKCCECLHGSEDVLELACGTGKISISIAQKANSVIGIDLTDEMIQIANEKVINSDITNVQFKIGDAYHTEFASKHFDVILLFNTLHIVKEPNLVLQEAKRLLRPGGLLITATDCYGEKLPFSKAIYHIGPKLLKRLHLLTYLTSYTKDSLRNLFTVQAFEIMNEEELFPAPLNYYILAKKPQ